MARTNIWDSLFGEIGRAVADVRQRVVEEPWFGRTATAPLTDMHRSVARQLGWVSAEGEPPMRAMTREEHAYSLGAADERERFWGEMDQPSPGSMEDDLAFLRSSVNEIER